MAIEKKKRAVKVLEERNKGAAALPALSKSGETVKFNVENNMDEPEFDIVVSKDFFGRVTQKKVPRKSTKGRYCAPGPSCCSIRIHL